jgi:UDP-N-acetylglucosamine 4,6-dehydratase
MRILITGGTGSFGQEITKLLLNEKQFSAIIIYSRDEQKQEQMQNLFAPLDTENKLRFFIGDVRDKDRLRIAFKNVHYIIHTAALKIVPAAEYNPTEYIKTNIIGSQNIIEVLNEQSSAFQKRVIALSTDKAVHPINLYGSTKLCMEKSFIAANNWSGGNAIFSICRYGNVAGSRGSVIPYFKRLSDNNKPISLTHRDMTRFWITLKDAAQFVFNRINNMEGGEIFIPYMKSFRVEDLANIFNKVGIVHTGIRPGEKLHEDLITTYEQNKCVYKDKYFEISDKNKTEYETDNWSLTSETANKLSISELKQNLVDEGMI